jgi:hypothetical protein
VDGESIILKESLALGTPILVNNNFKETIERVERNVN